MIAARLCNFLTLGVRRAFVRFVDDDEIPGNLLQVLGNALLLGEVKRGDTLAIALPYVACKLVAHHVGVHYLEGFIEFAIQFVLPLDGQWGRGEDKHVGDDAP